MGIDSKLVIKPKFDTHNMGFLEIWSDIEASMQAAGFKSPDIREKPHIKHLPRVSFEYSLGSMYTSYPILVPVPDSEVDFPYEHRAFFFYYTDLKNSERSGRDRESIEVHLGWHSNYKLAFYLIAFGLVDKYIVEFLDNDSSGEWVRLKKADIEVYLKEIKALLPQLA